MPVNKEVMKNKAVKFFTLPAEKVQRKYIKKPFIFLVAKALANC